MSIEHLILYGDLDEAYRLPEECFDSVPADATIGDIVELVTHWKPASQDEVFHFICDTIRHQLNIDGQFDLSSRLVTDVGFDGI